MHPPRWILHSSLGARVGRLTFSSIVRTSLPAGRGFVTSASLNFRPVFSPNGTLVFDQAVSRPPRCFQCTEDIYERDSGRQVHRLTRDGASLRASFSPDAGCSSSPAAVTTLAKPPAPTATCG